MRKLVLIAAMLMISASAHAGGYSFNVQGQKVRVNIPRGCASLNCINVSAPGLEEKFKNKDKDEDTTTSSSSKPATTATAPAAAPAPAPVSVGPGSKVTVLTAPEAAPAPAPAPAPQQTVTAPTPAPVSTSASSKITMLGAPDAAPSTSGSTLTAPQVSLSPAPAPVQVAAAPAAAPAQAAPARTSDSPIGVWMTEEKGSKVRIADCNGNLCGYSVDAKTGASGDKVLIDMKPTGDKWVGRVRDTRSGSNYNANIAMRGSDKLRMQGCAFGGMLCGGQTWTRVE